MFVQSEIFVEDHGGSMGGISIYGQESNFTTWRLAMMNMAIRPMIDRIIANIRESRILAELRDTLLPKLLSGEARVQIR